MGCKCSDSRDREDTPPTAPVPGNPLLNNIYSAETDLLLKGHYQENDKDNSLECSSNSSCITSNVATSHACDPIYAANNSKLTNLSPRNVQVCSFQRTSTNKSDASSKSIDEPTLKQSLSPPVVEDEIASDPALDQKNSPVVCQENHVFTCRLASSPKVDPSVTRVLGIDMLALPTNGKDEDKASSTSAIPGTLSLVDPNSKESTSANTTTESGALGTTSGDQLKDMSIIEKHSPFDASSRLHPTCTEPMWDNNIVENHVSVPETLSSREQLMEHTFPQKSGDDIECELSHSEKSGNIKIETPTADGQDNNTQSWIKIPVGDTLSISDPKIVESIKENTVNEDSVPDESIEGETKDMSPSIRIKTGDMLTAVSLNIEKSTWDNSMGEPHVTPSAPALEGTSVRTAEDKEELTSENDGEGLAQRHIEDTLESLRKNTLSNINAEVCAALKEAEDKLSSINDFLTHDTYSLKQGSEEAQPEKTIIESSDRAAPLEDYNESTLVTKIAAEAMTTGDWDCAKSEKNTTIIESYDRAPVNTKAISTTSFTLIATDKDVQFNAMTNISKNMCVETANAVSRSDAKTDFSPTPVLTTIDNKMEGDARANETKNSFHETLDNVQRNQSSRQEYQNNTATEHPVEGKVDKSDSFHANIIDCAGFYDHVIKDVQALKCFIGELRRDLFLVIEAKDQLMAGAEKEVISAESTSQSDHMKTIGKVEPKLWEERASNIEDLQKQFRCKVSNNSELPSLIPNKNREHQGSAGCKSNRVKDSDAEECTVTVKSVRSEVEALKCFIGDLARDLSSAIEGRKVSTGTEQGLAVEHSIDSSYLVKTNSKAEHETWKPRGRDNEDMEREGVKNNFELPTSVSNKNEEQESDEGFGDAKKDMIANDGLNLEISCSNYRDAKEELTIQEQTDRNAAEKRCELTLQAPEQKTSFSFMHSKNRGESCRETVVLVEENKSKEYFTTEHEDQGESTVKRIISKAIELAVEQLGKELCSNGSSYNYDKGRQHRTHTPDLQTDVSTKSPLNLKLSSTQPSKGSASREFGIFIVMIMFLILQNYYISVA